MEWISIDDELPEKGKNVLFACMSDALNYGPVIGYWHGTRMEDNYHLCMIYAHDEDDICPCTHWMPLPELPNAKQD